MTAEGGGVEASDVTGTLNVDTGGGPLSATSLTSPSAMVNGEGGGVTLGFTTAPASVRVDTGGGDASLSVPGGPYAVTADTGGSEPSRCWSPPAPVPQARSASPPRAATCRSARRNGSARRAPVQGARRAPPSPGSWADGVKHESVRNHRLAMVGLNSGCRYQGTKIMPSVRSTGPVSGTGVSAPVRMLVLAR